MVVKHERESTRTLPPMQPFQGLAAQGDAGKTGAKMTRGQRAAAGPWDAASGGCSCLRVLIREACLVRLTHWAVGRLPRPVATLIETTHPQRTHSKSCYNLQNLDKNPIKLLHS